MNHRVVLLPQAGFELHCYSLYYAHRAGNRISARGARLIGKAAWRTHCRGLSLGCRFCALMLNESINCFCAFIRSTHWCELTEVDTEPANVLGWNIERTDKPNAQRKYQTIRIRRLGESVRFG
jgi:hypothetical protein